MRVTEFDPRIEHLNTDGSVVPKPEKKTSRSTATTEGRKEERTPGRRGVPSPTFESTIPLRRSTQRTVSSDQTQSFRPPIFADEPPAPTSTNGYNTKRRPSSEDISGNGTNGPRPRTVSIETDNETDPAERPSESKIPTAKERKDEGPGGKAEVSENTPHPPPLIPKSTKGTIPKHPSPTEQERKPETSPLSPSRESARGNSTGRSAQPTPQSSQASIPAKSVGSTSTSKVTGSSRADTLSDEKSNDLDVDDNAAIISRVLEVAWSSSDPLKRLKKVDFSPLEGVFGDNARYGIADWLSSSESKIKQMCQSLGFHREEREILWDLWEKILSSEKRRKPAMKNLKEYDGLPESERQRYATKKEVKVWEVYVGEANRQIRLLDYKALNIILDRCRHLQKKKKAEKQLRQPHKSK